MGYQDPLERDGHIEDVLGYHPATSDTAPRHAAVRDAAIAFARELITHAPSSPERTLAFRHAQQAMMYGNAAIAINGGGPVPDDPGRVHEQGKPGLDATA